LTGQSHDYKRHGTTTLFAALEVATGRIMAAHSKRRRRVEFLGFMKSVAGFIYANATDNSPAIHCYFKNAAVCTAAAGAFIGALVGGVAGVVVGIIAGVAIGAAIGCAATLVFYLLCLLVCVLVAAIIAAIIALFGAFLGGSIGHAIGGNPFLQVDSGAEPSTGDYITTCGSTIIYGNGQHARVYWFVEHSALHGHSMAPSGQQWVHADPDVNLPLDTCQSLCPGNFTGIQTPPGGNGPSGGPPQLGRRD
jgi:hypothetical protein